MEELPLFTLSFSGGLIRAKVGRVFPVKLELPFNAIRTIDPYSAACRLLRGMIPTFEENLRKIRSKPENSILNGRNSNIEFLVSIKVHAEDSVDEFPDIWYDCVRKSGGATRLERRTSLTIEELQELSTKKHLPYSGSKNYLQCRIDLFDYFFAMKFNRATLLSFSPKKTIKEEKGLANFRAAVVRNILSASFFDLKQSLVTLPDDFIYSDEAYIDYESYVDHEIFKKDSVDYAEGSSEEADPSDEESHEKELQELREKVKELEKAKKDQDDHIKVEMKNMKFLSEENENINELVLKQSEEIEKLLKEIETLKQNNGKQISVRNDESERIKGLYETRIDILEKSNAFLSKKVFDLEQKLEEKDRVLGETLEEIEQERSRVELLESELHQEKLLNSIQPTKSSTRKTLEDEFFNNMLFLENAPREAKKERAKKGFNPVSFITGMF